MIFNLFSSASLLLAATCFLLCVVIFLSRKNTLHTAWLFFNISVGLWAAGAFVIAQIKEPQLALSMWRVVEVSVAFIAVLFFHVTVLVCDLKFQGLLKLCYIQSVLFSFASLLSPHFFPSTILVFNSIYYAKAGFLFYVFFSIWMSIVGFSQFKLFQSYLSAVGTRKNQLFYFIVATLVGFTGGATNFFPHFGLNLYPIGNLTIILYCCIVTYAITKYRLLDLSVVLTRTTIFIAIYSLVLGIPFLIAFGWHEKLVRIFGNTWWTIPLIISTILATVGPFIYVYIQQKAEDRIFQEQRRYQATLRQASTGMGKIKDLKKLVTLIVHIMTRTVRVEYSMVYLNDIHSKVFKLGAYRSRQIRAKYRGDIGYDTAIVRTLQETQNPIVYDEIKQRAQDGDLKFVRLESELKAINASLVVPSFVDDKLLAILVMGNKISGKIYTSDDLAVFSILANQSALAIENAQFYEDMKLTTAQLMKAEKMATIGIMADGLSHQINNRLHAMGFIAGDALDTLKIKNNLPMSLEVKEVMLDMEHALNRIESNVQQGGEIVQGLLKYTRKGEEGMTQVALDKLIAASLEMTQFKIKPGELIVNQDYSKDIPKIHGNFTQLQEVFFNMIDNAYDAMMQRKSELKEPNYAPTIKITAKAGSGQNLEIVFEDNGIGIRDEDKEKIFTPFFTTKLSSKKGTGLGLYVIQRLIEENHKGTVKYESKFKQGTKVYISLPT